LHCQPRQQSAVLWHKSSQSPQQCPSDVLANVHGIKWVGSNWQQSSTEAQTSCQGTHWHTESTHCIWPQQSSLVVQGFEASAQHRGVTPLKWERQA
jgi:hypothetical protein